MKARQIKPQIPIASGFHNRVKKVSQAACAAPSEGLELQLAKIWQPTMGVRSVGVKDNFFSQG